ncbi:hypothetical protein CTI12_AA501440 [Artemisia annua]|uniref:Uncharacterized protein n=1 Tax=Artemisia annua TaxID=35608 RepID=A0A2U1LA24_ARTAN|nr:hypothetical protein CTI12_AA501440 [Artemisia annua]
MGHLSYTRVRRRSFRTKGFRLNSKRFSVHRLRVKFFKFFKMLIRIWRSRWHGKRLTMSFSKLSDRSSRRDLVAKENVAICRLTSLSRSNSFYSEAIADCLEFIKRSSASSDDMPETYIIDKA